jgi:hypothetical protein
VQRFGGGGERRREGPRHRLSLPTSLAFSGVRAVLFRPLCTDVHRCQFNWGPRLDAPEDVWLQVPARVFWLAATL